MTKFYLSTPLGESRYPARDLSLGQVRFDPFWDLAGSLSSFFDHGFEDYSRRFAVEDTDAGYKLTLNLPGFKRDEVTVELERGLLTVRAKNARADFQQTVNVGGDIDVDKTEATLSDGVLAISLTRSEASKPRRIEIKA